MTRLDPPADADRTAVVGADLRRTVAAVRALAGREARSSDADERLFEAVEYVEATECHGPFEEAAGAFPCTPSLGPAMAGASFH